MTCFYGVLFFSCTRTETPVTPRPSFIYVFTRSTTHVLRHPHPVLTSQLGQVDRYDISSGCSTSCIIWTLSLHPPYTVRYDSSTRIGTYQPRQLGTHGYRTSGVPLTSSSLMSFLFTLKVMVFFSHLLPIRLGWLHKRGKSRLIKSGAGDHGKNIWAERIVDGQGIVNRLRNTYNRQ